MVNHRVGFNMEYRVFSWFFHSGTACYRKIPCVVDFIKLTFYHGLKRTWVAQTYVYIYIQICPLVTILLMEVILKCCLMVKRW